MAHHPRQWGVVVGCRVSGERGDREEEEEGNWERGLERWLNGLSPPGFGDVDDQCGAKLKDSSPNHEGVHKESSGERAQELGRSASKQKAEGTWSVCRCLKGHILQKVHILPRATLALEILALRPKTFPFLISMERRDLSPSGSGLAWVPILPHPVLAQASMKENLVASPQGFPEMSLPFPTLSVSPAYQRVSIPSHP